MSTEPDVAAGSESPSPDLSTRNTHQCVSQINKLLEPQNTVIAEPISWGSPEREMIQVVTAKADPRKRGKPSNFFASYCPFCGVKLNLG